MKKVKQNDFNRDLQLIEEGLHLLDSPKVQTLLPKRKSLKDEAVIVYDSKNIYAWIPKKTTSTFSKYQFYQVKQATSLSPVLKRSWRFSPLFFLTLANLPKKIQPHLENKPVINGALPSLFLKNQPETLNGNITNPYAFKEGFLATIIHEFAHAYFYKMASKTLAKKNDNYINTVIHCTTGQQPGKIKKEALIVPNTSLLSEIFAFCVEYQAAHLFWRKHQKRLNTLILQRAKSYQQTKTNLFLSAHSLHDPAMIIGKILFHCYPSSWQQTFWNLVKTSS